MEKFLQIQHTPFSIIQSPQLKPRFWVPLRYRFSTHSSFDAHTHTPYTQISLVDLLHLSFLLFFLLLCELTPSLSLFYPLLLYICTPHFVYSCILHFPLCLSWRRLLCSGFSGNWGLLLLFICLFFFYMSPSICLSLLCGFCCFALLFGLGARITPCCWWDFMILSRVS